MVAFYDYYYTIKDHQGSAKINIGEEYLDNRPSEGCRKALSYYPFGKAMNNWISWIVPFKDPYTYTGKKEETMHSLGWYDYGKRFYDPNYRLSFVSVDPLCEKYYSISPYAYCNNNPVNCIDPDGRDWYRHNETGDYYWQEGHDELEDYTNVGASVSIQLGEDSYFNTYQK
ncbi:RHS repeat-associated core domain-containing protein [Bacteroides salyersiae]|uniref:RHS repeat-associated core domain-containing protein n=1 Tax=Bacteroides salyersiae TaxID=291644 RepID=UPI0021AB5368|nr:RHS repeat-associated core domain-containing protein [Bacteroides salyersiae]